MHIHNKKKNYWSHYTLNIMIATIDLNTHQQSQHLTNQDQ